VLIYDSAKKKVKNEKLRKFIVLIFIFGGLLFTGFIFGILGGILGAASTRSSADGMASLAGALIGTIAGYPVGIVVGLLVLRFLFHVDGKLLYGVIGAIAGVVLIFVLAEPLHLFNIYNNILAFIFLLLPPLLAIAGYFYLRIVNVFRSLKRH